MDRYFNIQPPWDFWRIPSWLFKTSLFLNFRGDDDPWRTVERWTLRAHYRFLETGIEKQNISFTYFSLWRWFFPHSIALRHLKTFVLAFQNALTIEFSWRWRLGANYWMMEVCSQGVNHPRREMSTLVLQQFATSRHRHENSKIRTFWKAKTKFFKCLKAIECGQNHLYEEKYVKLIFFVFQCWSGNPGKTPLMPIFQRFVTGRHRHESSKVRTFWKAMTEFFKSLKVVVCWNVDPHGERYHRKWRKWDTRFTP